MKNKECQILIFCFLIISCGPHEFVKPASADDLVKNEKMDEKKDSISAKLLFYGDLWENTLDTCFIITSQEILSNYTIKSEDIDFNKNVVLLILKPFSSTYHQISFKDINIKQDTLIIRYTYEVTNKEVEGPPKKFGLLIPKVEITVKAIEYNINEIHESICSKEILIGN